MESLDWARGCLDYCERFHVQCRQRQSSLPKRVLDLQSISGHGSDLRLRVSRPHECGRYITLSHGWGTTHPPKTLLANVQTYLDRIRITTLSKRFQQVIQFVRSLGIHFLWIDSLCIIQDDEFDKLEQIPRMSEIYSNSTLTLAISHSKDSIGQLFNSTSQFQSGFSISNEEPDLLVRERFPHKDPVALAFDQRGGHEIINEVFPLLKRAWVFQERILASRMLHFGSYELHWECNAMASCECGIERPTNAKPAIQTLGTPYFVQFARLVNYYSTLELSYEEDILLALQGIIAQYEEITGEQNIAGLWENDL
ncbi:heterokaryon incompatibility protein-domain-containing protein, partial [Pyrenochaeta sp. MPI-SDFR-AT-0127]